MNRRNRIVTAGVLFLIGSTLLAYSAKAGTQNSLHPAYAVAALIVYVASLAFAAGTPVKDKK
jgi:hypothetical protein